MYQAVRETVQSAPYLVSNEVHVSAVLAVLLPVEEPLGNVELLGSSHDALERLNLLLSELTGPGARKCQTENYTADAPPSARRHDQRSKRKGGYQG